MPASHSILDTLYAFETRLSDLLTKDRLDVSSLGAFYTSLIEAIVLSANGSAGALVFIDPSDKTFDRIFSFNYGDNFTWWERVETGQGLVSQCLRDCVPIVTDDVFTNPSYKKLNPDTQSQITLPLIFGFPVDLPAGHPLGAIAIEFSHYFSKQEKESLLATNTQLSLTLERFEILMATRRTERALAFAAHIRDAADQTTAVNTVLDSIRVIVGHGEIAILRRIGGFLLVDEHQNIDDADIPRNLPIGISDRRGYTCLVAHTRQPFYCKNTLDYDKYPYYRIVVEGTRSQYTVPLIFRNDLVGVLNVGATTACAFSWRDRAIIDVIAQNAAYGLFYERWRDDSLQIALKAVNKLGTLDFLWEPVFNQANDRRDDYKRLLKTSIFHARSIIYDASYPLRQPERTNVSVLDCVEKAIRKVAPLFDTLAFPISTVVEQRYYATEAHLVDLYSGMLVSAASCINCPDSHDDIRTTIAACQNFNVLYTVVTVVARGRLPSDCGYDGIRLLMDVLKPGFITYDPGQIGQSFASLWLCDRIAGMYAGYLNIQQTDMPEITLTAYLKH